MDKPFCLICKKPRKSDPRVKYCCDKHRWRAWWQRAAAASVPTQALPLASLSAEAQGILPLGAPERLLIAIQLALVGMATTGARGYRVGTQHGQSLLMRWFTAVKLRQVPMLALEPFEWVAVPVRGTYAVAYMNRRCKPIGGPRLSIATDHADAWLNHSDDDRTYKPRPRGCSDCPCPVPTRYPRDRVRRCIGGLFALAPDGREPVLACAGNPRAVGRRAPAPQSRRRGPCTATKSGALGSPEHAGVTDADRPGAIALTEHRFAVALL